MFVHVVQRFSEVKIRQSLQYLDFVLNNYEAVAGFCFVTAFLKKGRSVWQ